MARVMTNKDFSDSMVGQGYILQHSLECVQVIQRIHQCVLKMMSSFCLILYMQITFICIDSAGYHKTELAASILTYVLINISVYLRSRLYA